MLRSNAAFGSARRAHAATVGVAEILPAFAGLLMEREIRNLSRLLEKPAHPFVAIIGGAKVSDKIKVLESLLERVDRLLIGGGMANTFLAAQGLKMGQSRVEESKLALARSLVQIAEERGVELITPIDAVVGDSPRATEARTVSVRKVPSGSMVLDIGPKTVKKFGARIASAATVDRKSGV